MKKPPLGLRPYWFPIKKRIQEILSAMTRYTEESVPIPELWILELKGLTSLYKTLEKEDPFRGGEVPCESREDIS